MRNYGFKLGAWNLELGAWNKTSLCLSGISLQRERKGHTKI
tara:strand:+ start:34 stop:156 length:123 start_codon:yes stop_codon:yes gene_type:complete